jgi:hypothetical protein
MRFGGGIKTLLDGAVPDGLVTDDGELTGAAPLGPSAGTIEVEGTSSSPIPAAKAGTENASVAATVATRAIIRAKRKSR